MTLSPPHDEVPEDPVDAALKRWLKTVRVGPFVKDAFYEGWRAGMASAHNCCEVETCRCKCHD